MPANPYARPTKADERERLDGMYAISLGIIFWAALIILPLWLLRTYSLSAHTALVQILQLAVIVYSASRLALLIARRAYAWLSVTFWLFVYSIIGIAQMVQLTFGDNPFHIGVSDPVITQQLAIVLAGCVAFDLCQHWGRGRSLSTREPRVVTLHSAVWLGIITLAMTPLLVQHFGGISTLFHSRYAFQTQLGIVRLGQQKTSDAILIGVGNVVPFVALFSLIQLRRARAFTFNKSPSMLLLFVAVLGCNVLLNNPISQPRFWVATMVAALLYSSRWAYRPAGLAVIIGGFILASTVLFPYLDAYRYAGVGEAQVQRHSVGYFFVNKTDYASPVDITNTVTYVNRRGHTGGRQLLGAALFWVPRSQWAGKPNDTGALLATEINFHNLNLDAPLWGEANIDFGLPGVVIVLGAFGFLVGRGDRLMRYPSRDGPLPWALVFLPILAGYEFIVLRGSLLQSMGRLTVLVAVCLLISRRPSPQLLGGAVTTPSGVTVPVVTQTRSGSGR